ncbi:MAG: hypothetical protein ABGX29_02725 [Candidatus Poseidoniia archaeon]
MNDSLDSWAGYAFDVPGSSEGYRRALTLEKQNNRIQVIDLILIFMGGIRIVDSNQEIENEYTARLADDSIEELVSSFNHDQPSTAWVGARGRFLAALRQAFLDTEIDCSSFISEEGMSLEYPIRLEENIIFQVKDN